MRFWFFVLALISFVSPVIAWAAIALPSGLVSWWPGDGNADDIHGANQGTLYGGAGYDEGNVNKSFSFDGMKGLVSAPTFGLPVGNADRTLELWVMIRSSGINEAFFAGYGGFGNWNQTYALGAVNTPAGSRVLFSQWGAGVTGPVMTNGRWYHVAAANQGNLVTLYLNGDAVATGTMTIDTPPNSHFYLGKIESLEGDTRRLNGCVDEVSIYDRALSAAEINAIYKAGPAGKLKPAVIVRKEPPRVPVVGTVGAAMPEVDEVMLHYRERIGCTAATLAISLKGRLLYSRGYGWRDRAMTIPTDPETMIGIASCDKPLIGAGIHNLIEKGQLGLDDYLFRVLPVRPHGPLADRRMLDITIKNLLDHKAGWGADPCSPAVEAAHQAGFKDPLSVETLLSFVLTRPLQDPPGAKGAYCNFGYDTLRHIIELKSGMNYIDFFCTELLGMRSARCLHSPGQPLGNDYPLIWNDHDGGPTSATAPILCEFMERYLSSGQRREGGPYTYATYGSLPGSTAMMLWFANGVNLVALFNGRAHVGHHEIHAALQSALHY